MLIFVNLVGAVPAGVKRKFPLEVEPGWTGADLEKAVLQMFPDSPERVSIRKLLSGGKIISEDATLQSCRLQKESSVQCLIGKGHPLEEKQQEEEQQKDEERLPLPPPPSLQRQRTELPIRFGEVVVIRLRDVRNVPRISELSTEEEKESTLPETATVTAHRTHWGEPSSVFIFAVLSHGHNNMSRSDMAVCDRNGMAAWPSQLFGFYIEDTAEFLEDPEPISVVVWYGGRGPADSVLGVLELELKDIPTDRPLEKAFPLQSGRGAEIQLSAQRATLSSPELQTRVDRLCRLQRPWKEQDFRRHQISSLEQILGLEPWIPGMPPVKEDPSSDVSGILSRVNEFKRQSSEPPSGRLATTDKLGCFVRPWFLIDSLHSSSTGWSAVGLLLRLQAQLSAPTHLFWTATPPSSTSWICWTLQASRRSRRD